MLSSKFVILAAVGFVAFVAAGPMGGGAMGGPFAELEKSLDETQKADLKAIFTKEGLTKQQIHDEIKAYFTKIGGDALVSSDFVIFIIQGFIFRLNSLNLKERWNQ